ncbi:MAG: sulfatase [Cyclobacteriaceae bacterium]
MRITKIIIMLAIFGVNSVLAQNEQNVLVFLVDDLRPTLGAYGDDLAITPNIDKLADEGIVFDKAYCQQAVCAPSRMSILTGNRVETIGIHSLFTPLRTVHEDMLTMPEFFKENGYQTVSIGKVYHHDRDDKANWSIHIPKEANTYNVLKNQVLLDSLKEAGVKPLKGPAYESADVEDDAYKDGRAARYAIETLDKLKDEKFMMFVGLSKPHLPFNAPKKYWDLYDRENFDIPNKEAPEGVSQYALTPWNELRGYYGMPKEGVLDDDLSRNLMHGYYACVSYVDAQVGKVMAKLDELGLRENTTVVFMSDHGWKLGEHGAWCKHTNFEIDTRVPLILSSPRSKKSSSGKRSNALVENIDVFPTLAEACGLSIPEVDGKSIMPLLNKPGEKWDKAAYSVFGRGDKIIGLSVTDGKMRYTEWRYRLDNTVHSCELYFCEVDHTTQSKNLAENQDYKEDLKDLKLLLYQQFPDTYKIPKYDN